MRKVKLQMQLSLDGYVAGSNGEMDWMTMNWGEDIIGYVTGVTNPVDTIVLGRKLAQGFIPHWTAAAKAENPQEFERKMHETPKVVFTNTITENDWEYTSIETAAIVQGISKLKNQEGSDIIVYGGGSFVSSLIQENLIDEYHFFINPVILGDGMPIFKNVEQRQNLKLVKSQAFECGIVVLCYEPLKA
jgi:dihydrofolate reductase